MKKSQSSFSPRKMPLPFPVCFFPKGAPRSPTPSGWRGCTATSCAIATNGVSIFAGTAGDGPSTNKGVATRWRKRSINHCGSEMAAIVGTQGDASDDDGLFQQLRSFIRQTGSRRGIEAMLKLVRSETGIPISPESLDAHPWLFNAENGTLDLRTGKLQSHRREDYLSKLCQVVYDANAQCPLWLEFQGRICAGNQSLIDFKQRFYGVSLTGDVSEQILAIYYGTGERQEHRNRDDHGNAGAGLRDQGGKRSSDGQERRGASHGACGPVRQAIRGRGRNGARPSPGRKSG